MLRQELICPVCQEGFNSFLALASHMVEKDRPSGPHIDCLELITGKSFEDFGFGKDKQIAVALRDYWRKHKSWPC